MTEREPTVEEIREAIEGCVERALPAYHIARMALRAAEAEARTGEPITFTYTNWRGETAERTATPVRIWYGSTDWHPEPGWLMTAYDFDKKSERDFALADCQFTPRPASPSPATVEAMAEALEPFAEVLSVYREFGEHQLLLLSEDSPKGRRLAHLLPEQIRRAENVFAAYRKEMGDAE